MLFTAPQTAPAAPLPGIIRPQHPHAGQSNEDDYDAAYLDARADDIVGQEADLPLFSPVEKVTKVVTSSELLARCSQFLSKADVERVKRLCMPMMRIWGNSANRANHTLRIPLPLQTFWRSGDWTQQRSVRV